MGYHSPHTSNITVFHLASNPNDSTTHHFTASPGTLTGTGSATWNKIYFSRPGRIVAVNLMTAAGIAAGTAEDISLYVRINNTTDYLVATVGAATQFRDFINNDLDIPFVAGDYFELKYVTPAWATNPEGFAGRGTVTIEQP